MHGGKFKVTTSRIRNQKYLSPKKCPPPSFHARSSESSSNYQQLKKNFEEAKEQKKIADEEEEKARKLLNGANAHFWERKFKDMELLYLEEKRKRECVEKELERLRT